MKKLLLIILFTPIIAGMALTALAADRDPRGGGDPIAGYPPIFSDVVINPGNVWAPAGKKVPVEVSGVVSTFPGSEISSMSFYLNGDTAIVPGNITMGEGGSFSGTVMVNLSKDGQLKEGKTYNGMIYALDSGGRLSMMSFGVTVLHDRGN